MPAACRARAEELAKATAGRPRGRQRAFFGRLPLAYASQRGRSGSIYASAPRWRPPFDGRWTRYGHVRAALGEDAVLRRRGLVVGLPGAKTEIPRRRAEGAAGVWAEHEGVALTQPAHSLVVFLLSAT